MARAVRISGYGLVTPLGLSTSVTWESLLAGRRIIDHAKVPVEFAPGAPRVSHLAIRAAREALANSAIADASVVVGTSKGPIEQWLVPPSRLSDVEVPVNWGLARVADDVAQALEIRGPRLTVSAACASGLHALIRGVLMIQGGEALRVLVVAAEASVHPLFIASFNQLGILPPPEFGCRPFDRSRKGFLISEAAAAVLLESADDQTDDITIERFALAANANHLTHSGADAGPLREVLRHMCGSKPVDLFHAHGTGTLQNDEMELAVLEEISAGQSKPPHVYSHKGALGHSLGAAGLVSIVINMICHAHNTVPPNVGTVDPLPMRNVKLSRETVRRGIGRSVAMASGFGGQIAAVSLVSDPKTPPASSK